jgi:uncharacterized protein
MRHFFYYVLPASDGWPLAAIAFGEDDCMSEIDKIFCCRRCGACCHGETTVSLDEDDQNRMIASLAMDRREVEQKYWRITGNVVQMQIRDGHCIFYDEGCLVHRGRPWRCAQWPLHPSILLDISNFSAISASCPGINPELSYAEFCVILRRVLAETIKVCC